MAKPKRDRMSVEQVQVLVNMYCENFELTEKSNCSSAWLKIQNEVNKHGPEKTVKQIKDKLRNLKSDYRAARDNNKKTGAALQTSLYFDIFDELFGTRDVVTLPNFTEVGASTTQYSSDDENDTGLENEVLQKCYIFFRYLLRLYQLELGQSCMR